MLTAVQSPAPSSVGNVDERPVLPSHMKVARSDKEPSCVGSRPVSAFGPKVLEYSSLIEPTSIWVKAVSRPYSVGMEPCSRGSEAM